jgi:hypothetical protein
VRVFALSFLVVLASCLDYGEPAPPDDLVPVDGVCETPLPEGEGWIELAPPDFLGIDEVVGVRALVALDDGDFVALGNAGAQVYRGSDLSAGDACAFPFEAPEAAAVLPANGGSPRVAFVTLAPRLCVVSVGGALAACDIDCADLPLDTDTFGTPGRVLPSVTVLGEQVYAAVAQEGAVQLFLSGPTPSESLVTGALVTTVPDRVSLTEDGATVHLSIAVDNESTQLYTIAQAGDLGGPVLIAETDGAFVDEIGIFAFSNSGEQLEMFAGPNEPLPSVPSTETFEFFVSAASFFDREAALVGGEGLLVVVDREAGSTTLLPGAPIRTSRLDRIVEGFEFEHWAIGTHDVLRWDCGPQGDPVRERPLDRIVDLDLLDSEQFVGVRLAGLTFGEHAGEVTDVSLPAKGEALAVAVVRNPAGELPAVATLMQSSGTGLPELEVFELSDPPGSLVGPVATGVSGFATTLEQQRPGARLFDVDTTADPWVARACDVDPIEGLVECATIASFPADNGEIWKLRHLEGDVLVLVTTTRVIRVDLDDNTVSIGVFPDGSAPFAEALVAGVGGEPEVVEGCLVVANPDGQLQKGLVAFDDSGNGRLVAGTTDVALVDVYRRGDNTWVALGTRGALYEMKLPDTGFSCTAPQVELVPEAPSRSSQKLEAVLLRGSDVIVADFLGRIFQAPR